MNTRQIISLIWLSWMPTSAVAQFVLGPPGTVATYELAEDPVDRPAFESQNRLSVTSATIRLGPVVEKVGQPLQQWYNLEFTRQNGDRYRVWILLDSWPGPTHDPLVTQYTWQEPDWPDALNFVHEVSGQAQLPRLELWSYGWPQQADSGALPTRAPVAGTPEQIRLHGWLFRRNALEENQQFQLPEKQTNLPLNPDLLNGWVSFDRDQAGRPAHLLGKSADGQSRGYEYIPKTADDLQAYANVGANFLVTHPGQRARENFPAWLTRSSMYHNNLAYQPLDWPADLYRSNYWGFGNHIDEPGVHNWGLDLDQSNGAALPEIQAVEQLERLVLQGVQQRGQSSIQRSFSKNFGLGNLQLREGPQSIFSWEYEWPTAWYQLALDDGVGGIVDEDVTTGDLVESYNLGLGTSIAPTVENAVAIRVAILRGAARNFNKKWGVAFYHPNEVKLKSATIPLLYEKGAHCFWYWTGWIGITDNSGLPYPYQIYYTSLVREAILRNPRRHHEQLLRAARVAIVLPYGYTFTPYAMHRIAWLHLERKNEHGIPYRHVLANAAQEVERLLRLGIDFDIVIQEPRLNKSGYDELVFAQADGKIRIERDGRLAELRDQPRDFVRPDLGPGPRLSIEVMDAENEPLDQIRFRAIGRLGTGDWAAERAAALVSWEVYGPDNRVRPPTFPEYGAVYTLQLDHRGRLEQDQTTTTGGRHYTLRAAMADVFGRPAIAYRTIFVRDAN